MPSSPRVRPATMPKRPRRWAFACSTPRRSRRAMHRRSIGAERVAVVDWDVHHGNGTQDIFWDDPSVLYCSTHQMPLYPGTGAKNETGAGNIVNAPLAPQHRQRGFSRCLPVARPAGARQFRARPDHHFSRFRRAPSRSAGRDQPDRGRFRLGDRPADGARRAPQRQPARQPARGRLRSAGIGIFGRRPCRAADEGIKYGWRSQ